MTEHRNWRWCADHPTTRSLFFCPACVRGWCGACTWSAATASICRDCDVLCVPAARQEKNEAAAALRERGMGEDLATILRYPFGDPLAWALLALLVCGLGLGAEIAPRTGVLVAVLREALLLAYAATALERTGDGRLDPFMLDLVDLGDLVRPLVLGVAAFLVSALPLIALIATRPELRGNLAVAIFDRAPGAGLALLAGAWLLVYLPIALLVAGTSHSVWKTLNPLLGVVSIGRMGVLYWHTAAIVVGLLLVRLVFGLSVGSIPLAGSVLAACADCYLYLALGCAIGLAIYKRSSALGLETQR